jgi:hypothetical protein
MTDSSLHKPGDVHTDNIIHPNFDELLEEKKQEYETVRKSTKWN